MNGIRKGPTDYSEGIVFINYTLRKRTTKYHQHDCIKETAIITYYLVDIPREKYEFLN